MCLGEFGCSFSEYENMTWAEFQIRLFAFSRIEKREWIKTRFLAYQVYVSNWQNPKKSPVSIERYFPLENEKPQGMSVSQRQAILNAQKEYNNKK